MMRIEMVKDIYHPNAYLSNIRNVRLGLRARTKILNVMEKTIGDAKTIATQAGLSYAVTVHHLKLLGAEEIVDGKDHKPSIWATTGKGQKRLMPSI
jgi:predicted transcriptional regulator